MIIKNYKELCNLLNEKVKTGYSKQKQLKTFDRYFKYHKEGFKFIIEEIYKEVKPDFSCNHSKYIQEIQDILINYIYENRNNKNEVILSFGKMINILGLVNNTYSIANYRKKELSEILNIELSAIYYFYNNSRSEFKNIIERSLNSLQKRSVLEMNDVYMIVEEKNKNKKNKYTVTRQATSDEVSLIVDARYTILKHMNMENLKELFLSGIKKFKEFNALVKKELPKEWLSYYKAYKLIYGENAIATEYKILAQKEKLNKKSIDRLHKSLKINSEDKENELIEKLISLLNYDFRLDEQLQSLAEKHKKDYYEKLNNKQKEINKVNYEISKINEEYENRDIIEVPEYLKYKWKFQNKNKFDLPEEYYIDLYSYIDSLASQDYEE